MAGPQEIPFDIVARDKASRELGKVARELDKTGKAADRAGGEMADAAKDAKLLDRAAEGAGDSMAEAARDAGHLDRQLRETERHLRDLIKQFDATGDKTLLRDIGKDRRSIGQLSSLKKAIGDEIGDVGKHAGKGLVKNLGETLATLPMQLKGAGIVAGAALAIGMAPVIGATIGGAVLGGVGAGGIIGGIALAAQDPAVKAAGTELGQSLMSSFTAAGKPFVDPLLDSMRQLDGIGADFAADLRQNFAKIAPTLTPLTKGLDGFLDALGPGLSDAFDAAAPVLRLIAAELPKLGDAFSDALSAMSEESDGAIMALKGLFQLLESVIRVGGDVIAWLSAAYENMARFGAAVTGVAEDVSRFVPSLYLFSAAAGEQNDKLEEQIAALDAAKNSTGDYAGEQKRLGDQTIRTTTSMQELADELKKQSDPMFALTDAIATLKDKQATYNEVVKEHGKNSREAKDASLELAKAAIGMRIAAADAAGTFDGTLDPAMKATLKAAGLTEQQIRDVEGSFRKAKAAGENFARTYTAHVKVEGTTMVDRNLGFRASGGPVKAGKTYVVGEQGPEVVTFGEDGYVHDAAKTKAMLSGSSGGSAMPMGAGGFPPIKVVFASSGSPGGLEAVIWSMIQRQLSVSWGGDVSAGLGVSGGGPL